jgi:hypothetical protein
MKQLRICNGCLIKCAYCNRYKVGLTPESTILKCPCVICLVRMVCNTGCDEYTKFSKEEFKRRNSEFIANNPVIRTQ